MMGRRSPVIEGTYFRRFLWPSHVAGVIMTIGIAVNLDLLLQAEGFLQIVRVNIVTGSKRARFEHCAQRSRVSSSTAELSLML